MTLIYVDFLFDAFTIPPASTMLEVCNNFEAIVDDKTLYDF